MVSRAAEAQGLVVGEAVREEAEVETWVGAECCRWARQAQGCHDTSPCEVVASAIPPGQLLGHQRGARLSAGCKMAAAVWDKEEAESCGPGLWQPPGLGQHRGCAFGTGG